MRTIKPTRRSITSRLLLIFTLAAAAIVAFPEMPRAIAANLIRTMPASDLIIAAPEMGKHMPRNARTPEYTPAMADSDSMLAAIFGGPGALAAANGFEPMELARQYPLYRGDLISDDGRMLRGHLSDALHLYGSANGTVDTEIYVPGGFISHSSRPTPTDAAVTFYYLRLGSLKNVTLAVFHIADFRLDDRGERVRIGHTGGRGGSIACYRHSHIEFYSGNTGLPSSSTRPGLRIEPAHVFGAPAHIASRSVADDRLVRLTDAR